MRDKITLDVMPDGRPVPAVLDWQDLAVAARLATDREDAESRKRSVMDYLKSKRRDAVLRGLRVGHGCKYARIDAEEWLNWERQNKS